MAVSVRPEGQQMYVILAGRYAHACLRNIEFSHLMRSR